MSALEAYSQHTHVLINEIKAALITYSTASHSNALSLNQELQRYLEEIRKKLTNLLQILKERYRSNEEMLMGRMRDGVSKRGAILQGRTFYFKGNMYFRDGRGRHCPSTADYEYRCNVENEMFPTDFNLRARHIWSLRDKSSIVRGIKQQVISHLGFTKYRLNKADKEVTLYSSTLVSLLKKAGNDFEIDWHEISAIDLCHRHSPCSCEAMWKVYLCPSLNRKEWTADEDNILIEAAKKHKFQNWPRIAAEVGQRSDYQCMVRMQTALKKNIEVCWAKWNKADDELLLKVIEDCSVNGVINWNAVNANFPRKPKSSLIARYYYTLNPQISHERFTPEEDLLLLAAVEEYKGKFSLIPRTLFPNRSLCQLRSRYHTTLTQRNKIEPWSYNDDKLLIEFVAEHGTSAWVQCAKKLGNHTRVSCRTRFFTIKRFSDKNPNAKLEDIPRREMRASDNSITPENWMEKLCEISNAANTTSNIDTTNVVKDVDTFESSLRKRSTQDPAASLKKYQRRRKKSTYRQSLRSMNRRIYDFLKFGYNQSINDDLITRIPRTHDSLQFVANALECLPADDSQLFVISKITDIDTALDYNLGLQYSELLQTLPNERINLPKNYSLPLSWSTAMGFRALCILSSQESQADTNCTYNDDDPDIQLFRKRFHALFFQTALLSRLNSDSFNGLCAAIETAANSIPTDEKTIYEIKPIIEITEISTIPRTSSTTTLSETQTYMNMADELAPSANITNDDGTSLTLHQFNKRCKVEELPMETVYKIEHY